MDPKARKKPDPIDFTLEMLDRLGEELDQMHTIGETAEEDVVSTPNSLFSPIQAPETEPEDSQGSMILTAGSNPEEKSPAVSSSTTQVATTVTYSTSPSLDLGGRLLTSHTSLRESLRRTTRNTSNSGLQHSSPPPVTGSSLNSNRRSPQPTVLHSMQTERRRHVNSIRRNRSFDTKQLRSGEGASVIFPASSSSPHLSSLTNSRPSALFSSPQRARNGHKKGSSPPRRGFRASLPMSPTSSLKRMTSFAQPLQHDHRARQQLENFMHSQQNNSSPGNGDPYTDIDLGHVGKTLLNLHVRKAMRLNNEDMPSRWKPTVAQLLRGKDLSRTLSAPVHAKSAAVGQPQKQEGSGGSIRRNDSISLLSSAVRGLGKGARPTAIEVGNLSGVYKLYDGSQSPIAVFKPRDEEFMADAIESGEFQLGSPNPNYPGLRLGEGALRERAAYVLDKLYGGFSGVPTTTLTRIKARNNEFRERKRDSDSSSISPQSDDSSPADANDDGTEYIEGSMQEFVSFDTTAGDLSINALSATELRKIAILDLCVHSKPSAPDLKAKGFCCFTRYAARRRRLFNGDRHGDNILVVTPKGRPRDWAGSQLIPIDHGSCLPDFRYLSVTEFVWWNSRAAKAPLSKKELAYIAALDTEKDASLLRKLGIREECVVTCIICTNLLKLGAQAGLNLSQIVSLVRRPYEYNEDGSQKASCLEGWVQEALDHCPKYKNTLQTMDSKLEVPTPPVAFFDALRSKAMDQIQQLLRT